MRVLLDVSAVPARPVGAGVYTIAVARGVAARTEIDLHLLTRRADTDRWRDLAPTATLHPDAPNGRPARLAWEQTAGPRVARRVRPDVWHAPHYTMPLRSPVPTVVAMHDLTFFDHPEWHERSKVVYFRRMIAASARRADVIITGSHDAAEGLRARFRPRGEIVVVHHGVDSSRFSPVGDAAADTAALAGHGIAPPYIAFASTIEPRKDVPTLVGAFARTMRETDAAAMARADLIVVDSREGAMAEGGDLVQAIAEGAIDAGCVAATLADLACGRHPGRTRADAITVFKSVGFALEDLAAAEAILDAGGSADSTSAH